MRKGDIITALDGDAVESYNELSLALRRRRAGQDVEMTVYREGDMMTLQGVLDEKPAPEPQEQQVPVQPTPNNGDAYRINPFDFFDWGF